MVYFPFFARKCYFIVIFFKNKGLTLQVFGAGTYIILKYSRKKKKLLHDCAFLKLDNLKDLYLQIKIMYLEGLNHLMSIR